MPILGIIIDSPSQNVHHTFMQHYKHRLYEGNFVQSKAVLRVLRRTALVVLENGNYAKQRFIFPADLRHGRIFGNRCVGDRVCWSREIVAFLLIKCRLLSTSDLLNVTFAEIVVLFY